MEKGGSKRGQVGRLGKGQEGKDQGVSQFSYWVSESRSAGVLRVEWSDELLETLVSYWCNLVPYGCH